MAAIAKSLQSCIFASRYIAYRGCNKLFQVPQNGGKGQAYYSSLVNDPTNMVKPMSVTADDPISSSDIDASPGPERWELIHKVKGIEDPFDLQTKTVEAGTQAKPTIIATICQERTVGCICQNDDVVIKWMKLSVGETKKCECGNWFKLVPYDE